MKRNNRNPHNRRQLQIADSNARALEPTSPTTQATSPDELTVTCPKCKTKTDVAKAHVGRCLRCPECGCWIHVRLAPDLSRYVRGLGVTPSGNDTLDIADATADVLRGLGLDELYDVASIGLRDCGFEAMSRGFAKSWRAMMHDQPFDHTNIRHYLMARYMDRNPGMQRMNLGNLLRAAQNRRSQLNLIEAFTGFDLMRQVPLFEGAGNGTLFHGQGQGQ